MPPVSSLEHADGMERNLLQRTSTMPREIGFFRVVQSLSRQPRCWLDAFLMFADASGTQAWPSVRYANEIRDRSTLLHHGLPVPLEASSEQYASYGTVHDAYWTLCPSIGHVQRILMSFVYFFVGQCRFNGLRDDSVCKCVSLKP